MVKENIKVLTQLVNKPVKDFDENDIDKIIESDRKSLLLDVDTVEYLVENTNESVSSTLMPIYIQLSFKETMRYIETLLEAYYKDPEKNSEELKIQMLSYLESDGLIEFLAAARIIQCVFPDVDLMSHKSEIISALEKLQKVVTTIPMPNGKELIEQLTGYLYYPLIVDWKVKYKEVLITEENVDFLAKINEYSEFIKNRREEEIKNYFKELNEQKNKENKEETE